MIDYGRGSSTVTGGRSRSRRAPGEPPRHDRHESIWNALPFPAFTLDGENRIKDANVAAELFLGQSATLLSRMKLEDFCQEGARLLDLVDQARRDLVTLSEFGLELPLRDREPRFADVQVATIFDQDDSILVIIQPQSAAAAVDRSLSKQGASRGLSGFSAMMAHEIKNPLAAISGAAQLLEMNLGDEENELLRLVQDEVDRIRALLDRMDAFGSAGPLSREPVNIHHVLEQARRAAAAGYGRHVRFRELYDPSLPPVPGDRVQLLQAISNLVKNATEAAPTQGGEVVLKTAYRPGVNISVSGGARMRLPLEVSVIDNGSGVPEDLRAHIFEPFVTSKANGNGLGLALVAKIVADHGGVIEYARKDDRTIFRLLLPVWREEPKKRAGAGAERSAIT